MIMQVSAEIRLFWHDRPPDGLQAWFLDQTVHGCAPGGSMRTDLYLHDGDQTELGVKQRGSNPDVDLKGIVSGIEVKGLVTTLPVPIAFAEEEIQPEIWSKWSSRTLYFDIAASMTLQKRRWLRKFDISNGPPEEVPLNDVNELPVGGGALPKSGCNVEWTVIKAPAGDTVWTLGFESFGSLTDVEGYLRSVVAVMERRKPPRCEGGFRGGYPAWLSQWSCPPKATR